jgi:hypothetical protein
MSTKVQKLALVEAGGGSLATAETGQGRRFRARLIAGDVLGSSGYYSREVVERDGPKVFPAGTHVYLDHPTESEKFDRPERSIRDLAGRIASTPVYERDGLYADVEVIPQIAPTIEALQDDIGMSIRASGTYELGERDGRQVKVITALTAAESVDFVTKAGAGGRITALIESARKELHEATANDTRQALDSALTDRFGGEDTYVWVCDYDDELVWYQVSGPDSYDTYQLGFTITDDAVVTLSDDEPVEVTRRTEYVPVSTGGSTTTTESRKDNAMPEIKIDEAEHRRLTEAAARAEAAEARAVEAEKKQAASEAKIAEGEARTDAKTRAEKLLESVDVRDATKTRIVESVVVGLPMNDGKLDVAAFETRVNERATSEAAYEAALLKEAGVGSVSGEGGGSGRPAGGADATAVQEAEATIAAEFERMGLSEAHAKAAAAGRD